MPRTHQRRTTGTALAMLMACAQLHAASDTQQLNLVWAGGASPSTVTLQLDGDPSRTLEATVPGAVHIDPGSAHTAQVVGLAWSPVVELTGDTLIVPIFRTVAAVGRWASRSPLANSPESVALSFQTDFDAQTLDGRVDCTVFDDQFSCRLPAAVLDLRLDIDDFAPTFFWQHAFPEPTDTVDRPHDLGIVDLVTGASLSGWVVGPTDTTAGLEITFRRRTASPGIDAGRTTQHLKRFHATVDDEGFFYAHGLLAGAYALHANQAVDGASWVAHVPRLVLDPGAHHRLDDPVILEEPTRLDVYVEPMDDPYGQPWTLQLMRPSPVAPNAWAPVGSGQTEVGAWQGPPVTAGTHRLILTDSTGAAWGEQSVEVEPAMAPIQFEVDFVRAEGRVTLGDEPVTADLWFGGRHGEVSITTRSNRDGRYSIVLPQVGLWDVDIARDEDTALRLVDIDITPPRGQRLAEVDLELPNTRVFGVVIDANRQPVQGATVFAKDSVATKDSTGAEDSGDDASRITTNADGVFVIEGVAVGDIELRAYDMAGDRYTARQNITVEEDVEVGPVILSTEDEREVRGVLTLGGQPVTEGLIVAELTGPALSGPSGYGGRIKRASWDVSTGQFVIRVPRQSTGGHLIVHAAGAGARLIHQQWPTGDGLLNLALDSRAGTLTFELTDLSRLGTPLVVVQRDTGAELALETLVGQLTPRPAGPSRLTIATPLAVGPYALCLAGTAECTGGELAPGAELVLSVLNLPSLAEFFDSTEVH